MTTVMGDSDAQSALHAVRAVFAAFLAVDSLNLCIIKHLCCLVLSLLSIYPRRGLPYGVRNRSNVNMAGSETSYTVRHN